MKYTIEADAILGYRLDAIASYLREQKGIDVQSIPKLMLAFLLIGMDHFENLAIDQPLPPQLDVDGL